MTAYAELIQYDEVPPDGDIGDGVVLPVDGVTLISEPDGSCGVPGCGCFRGHFFQRLFPRDNAGTVFGYIVAFDTRGELEMLDEGQIACLAQKAMQ